MTRRRWLATVTAAVVLLTAAIWIGTGRESLPADRDFAIGWEENPPNQVRGADGEPTGFAVDLVKEAARRRAIRLRWLYLPRQSEPALLSGRVDLWPIATITEERRRRGIFFSDPYQENDYAFFVRGDSPYLVASRLGRARVTANAIPVNEVLMKQYFPGAAYTGSASLVDAVQRTCRGEFDAAFSERNSMLAALLAEPLCPGVPLRVLPIISFRMPLGVAANARGRVAAVALRRGIEEMIDDGTVERIGAKWGQATAQATLAVAALNRANRQAWWYRAATVGSLALLIASVTTSLAYRRARNRAEAAARALVAAERERATLREQLAQGQRLESIGRLAGGVAHDFNNLLAIIVGFGDMLVGTQKNQESEEHLAQVLKAASRAADLTGQLLAFSRKQVVQPKVVQLNALVEDTSRMIRRLIGEDVELRLVLDPATSPILVDPGQINQVLMNLAANARDAIPGVGSVVVETGNVVLGAEFAASRAEVAPGDYVQLTVTDSGVGMDRMTLDRVFEPFFSTKGTKGGTGLGLATVYGIVKQAGGHVWAYSEPGHGTTFKVCFPKASAEPVADVPAERVPVPRTPTETVLVVEDLDAVRTVVTRMLRAAGYGVLDAATGAAALRIADEHPSAIELVVSDLVMPEMSGREMVERLAARRPGIKVLFMSGYTEDVSVRRGALGPGVNFIAKPFSASVLLARVRQVLDGPPPAPPESVA